MNSLEKFFNSIKSSPTAKMKAFTTKELIKQLPEFDDNILFILKNVYSLISSDNFINRLCGSFILNNLDLFEYNTNFILSNETTDYVYLQYKDILEDGHANKEKQKVELKKKLKLEHADSKFLETIDFSSNAASFCFNTQNIEEKKINNVYDFFEAISILILSPEWFKRQGAFLAHCAMLAPSKSAFQEDINLFIQENSIDTFSFDNFDSGDDSTDDLEEMEISLSLETQNIQPATSTLKYKINVEPKLFNFIFEILKNDKFNDFVCNKTSAPVRETASLLLRYIYRFVNDQKTFFFLISLLESNDWQEQFSGLISLSHLKEYLLAAFNDPKIFDIFMNILFPLLEANDEDIKYLSAELLSFFIKSSSSSESFILRLVERAWSQINEEVDIAHSKASIIQLLTSIYSLYNLNPPESFATIYPCFTSPIALIRNSVLEFCKLFDSEELIYLLGECVLLSTDQKYKKKCCDLLIEKMKRLPNLFTDFASHYHSIISTDPFIPYKSDDFVCYEDSFFTRDGLKSIGLDLFLGNRVDLFNILLKVPDYKIQNIPKNLLSDSFKFLKIYFHSQNDTENKSLLLEDVSKCKAECDELSSLMLASITDNFKSYTGLKKMPMKEFSAVFKDPFYITAFPMCIEHIEFYIRMFVSSNLYSLSDFDLYFMLESCEKFFRLIIEILILKTNFKKFIKKAFKKLIELKKHANKLEEEKTKNSEKQIKTKTFKPKNSIENDLAQISNEIPKSKKSAKADIESSASHNSFVIFRAMRNYRIFFEIIGNQLLVDPIFNEILNDPDRLIFFESTIHVFVNSNKVEKIFEEALISKNVLILKEYLKILSYNEKIVHHLLDNFDVQFLASILDYSDPSFNVLFTKLVLKNISAAGAKFLLSRILLSITFKPNPNIKQDLKNMILSAKEEVEMIVFPTKIPTYELQLDVSCDLRDYQKEGIKWLAFLNRFNLNGILADDMGLGKTIQVLSYLLSEHERLKKNINSFENIHPKVSCSNEDARSVAKNDQEEENEPKLSNAETNRNTLSNNTQLSDSKLDVEDSLCESYKDNIDQNEQCESNLKHEKKIKIKNDFKSLIVCPSSLTTHWKDEIKKYFNKSSIIYDSKTKRLSEEVVITTYDAIRKDDGILTNFKWFMVAIDEAHLLKNRGTVLYSKICKLNAERKILLTGTPVMNSVEDIYSLLNIVMPGYLGDESEFVSKYGCKVNDKNVKEMEERLKSLHKKILPFVMRRLKRDVLKDLPEKIIKDIIVEMKAEHYKFYKDIETGEGESSGLYQGLLKANIFGKQSAHSKSKEDFNIQSILKEAEDLNAKDNLIASEQSLNNRIADSSDREIQSIEQKEQIIYDSYKSLNKNPLGYTKDLLKAAANPMHFNSNVSSSKTEALNEIFSICGERKILIFFQLKKTIDFVIKELNLGEKSFLRLDGSIPASQRGEIVSRFQNENIQYFFLTTSIGGLGLNLTCADTVIFYEHDWNPFNDLQAMDRAHRLGQKNTVNVFRLICKDTIEEKVMSYQNFKYFVANTVVTQQNTNIEEMDTRNLLERFE